MSARKVVYVPGISEDGIVDSMSFVPPDFQWYLGDDGYAVTEYEINGEPVRTYLHRVILARKLGRPIKQGYTAEHTNGDKLDNRSSNLREIRIKKRVAQGPS